MTTDHRTSIVTALRRAADHLANGGDLSAVAGVYRDADGYTSVASTVEAASWLRDAVEGHNAHGIETWCAGHQWGVYVAVQEIVDAVCVEDDDPNVDVRDVWSDDERGQTAREVSRWANSGRF